MRGTVIGHFVSSVLRDRLLALRPEDMPEQGHRESNWVAVCKGKCAEAYLATLIDEKTPNPLPLLARDVDTCPTCGGETRGHDAGKRIEDGRYLYGLTFHDPEYDPSRAVVGVDCSDRTLTPGDTGSAGQTVAEAEAAGHSFGLERYQTIYKASSKHPTDRHRVPSIDGACGLSSVEQIIKAVGYQLTRTGEGGQYEFYTLEPATKEQEATQ